MIKLLPQVIVELLLSQLLHSFMMSSVRVAKLRLKTLLLPTLMRLIHKVGNLSDSREVVMSDTTTSKTLKLSSTKLKAEDPTMTIVKETQLWT